MEKNIYTGKGIGVCILDTGIYEHIDFSGRIWAFYDFLSIKGILMMIMDMAPMWQDWLPEMGVRLWENTEVRHRVAGLFL